MADGPIRRLEDDLVLRRGTPADAEALCSFNASIHCDRRQNKPSEPVGAWARDLAARPHPTTTAEHYTIVEETSTGRIVSSVCDIPQTWAYEGVPFGVGRPELVGTLPEYRGRGLVRAQFEALHDWSARRGDLLQAITGIPYFYRQFGYEMAVHLNGGRAGDKDGMPALKEGEQEPFRVRPAVGEDIPTLASIYDQACKRHLLSGVHDEAFWRYELTGRSEKNVHRQVLSIIEQLSGEPVGLLAHSPVVESRALGVAAYELTAGVSWGAVTPTVLRYLKATGEQCTSREQKPFTSIVFRLGVEHPSYSLVQSCLPRVFNPYAWYIRVADLPTFLRHIAPVLEARLASSTLVGHTGDVTISFYRSGLRLAWQEGHLAAVEPWTPSPEKGGSAAFPDRTFLQPLLGYRSTEELAAAFPDCRPGDDTTRTLLSILFPKRSSNLWPLA